MKLNLNSFFQVQVLKKLNATNSFEFLNDYDKVEINASHKTFEIQKLLTAILFEQSINIIIMSISISEIEKSSVTLKKNL